jgi:hypothetical protein
MIPLVDNRFGHVTKLFYALFHPAYFPFSPCDSSVVPRSSYTAPRGLLSAPAGFLTHSFFIAEAVRRKSAAGRPSHISGPRTLCSTPPLHAFVSDVHSGCHTQTFSSRFFVSNRRLTTQTRHSNIFLLLATPTTPRTHMAVRSRGRTDVKPRPHSTRKNL